MFTGRSESRYEIACIVSVPHLGAAFKKCLIRTENEAERELPMSNSRCTGTVLWARFLIVFVFSVGLSTTAFGQLSNSNTPQVSADQLVAQVVANETKLVDSDHSHWMYRQHRVEDDKNVVKECVETTQGALCRLLAESGHPLSQAEQDKERERLLQLVNNPEEQRRLQQARKDDSDQALKMLKMLPNAFQYQYAGAEGHFVRLKFVPNPAFHPPDRQSRVFHSMVGFMSIDRDQKRIAEINGKLIRDVDFGFGLLGHLYRGGTFQVKRAEVGDRHWETTLLEVKIRGKALCFKTINADQEETTENFREVPNNLSLAQGLKMLETPGHALEAKAMSGTR
jgi:hypothetical protein